MKTSSAFAYERCMPEMSSLNHRFQNASPFSHLVLDQFLDLDAAERVLAEFQELEDKNWMYLFHVNENKFTRTDIENFGPGLQRVIQELNSPQFIDFLSQVTGIENLTADDTVEGGGLSKVERGGHLNVHTDFLIHPRNRDWRRKVNLILYLNKDWKDEYGGGLELWDSEVKNCVQRVRPDFNRAVIFHTHEKSFHGFPEVVQCPSGVSRKSINLYYYVKETSPMIRSTNYQARPKDSLFKRLAINFDKLAVRFYFALKRRLKIEDEAMTKILEVFSGKKKKNGEF